MVWSDPMLLPRPCSRKYCRHPSIRTLDEAILRSVQVGCSRLLIPSGFVNYPDPSPRLAFRCGLFPVCPSERSRWRGGRYRVPNAGGIGDSRVASLKNDRSRVTMSRIVDWDVMDRSMIINTCPFAEFRFWQGFPGDNRLKFRR